MSYNFSRFSQTTSHLHILNHKIRSAKIYESKKRVIVLELQMTEQLCQLQVAIILVNNISIWLYDLESFHELLLSILIYHVLLELRKLTSWYIYHVLLFPSHWLLRKHIRLSLLLLRVLFFLLVVPVFFLRYWCLLWEWTLRNSRGITWRGWLTLLIRFMQVINIVHKHLIEKLFVLSVLWLVFVQLQFS